MEDRSPQQQAAYLERGRLLFEQPCDFVKSCAKPDQLPESDLPEIAFVGRSNVGKSSLINALLNRKDLARTSNTPGRTQEINFFNLGNQLHVVDLPGYGYAKAPRTKVLTWQKLILSYLRGRPQLKRVFVLIDSRHGLKPLDADIFKVLDDAAVSYQVILTKTDKIKEPQVLTVHGSVTQAITKFIAAHPVVHKSSSRDRLFLEDIRAEVAELIDPA